MTGCDNDDEIENEIHDANGGDVGFGSPDLYDRKQLMELLTEDPGMEVKHEAHDKVKQLEKDSIGKGSKILCRHSLFNF